MIVRQLPIFICLLTCTADIVRAADRQAQPERTVSLDYCADQFVLAMLPATKILAVSPDATQHYSYMRDRAKGIPQVRPRAEDVLSLRPDLVVRSYGGGPRVDAFLGRSGIPVLQLPFTNDIDDIRSATVSVAVQLGERERGEAIVADMNKRLAAIDRPQHEVTVLYMTSNGVTSGPGTLVHEMLEAAGLTNFEQRAGWHAIPLERLAYEKPDIVAAAFFNADTDSAALWSAMRHPVARRQMRNLPTVMLQGAWVACGGWFLLDAIEALAQAGAGLP